MIPYAEIIENADRRWTGRLVERLCTPEVSADELDELTEALCRVSDPRAFPVLEHIVSDQARPAPVREAAGTALRDTWYGVVEPPDDHLRRWWREGDAILRRHALLTMDALACPEIVLDVARHPDHPLHADALARMVFDFDRPEHEALKIAALYHPDPDVRGTAARILFFDEPVAAEAGLIEATRDPVPEVAAEAVATLQYYPSRRTIRCMHELRDHPSEVVNKEAVDRWDGLRNEILPSLQSPHPHVAGHLREWLRPVWDCLAFTEDELAPCEESPYERPTPVRVTMSLPELLALLGDPDVSPELLRQRLFELDWRPYTVGERKRLRPVLLSHLDGFVRDEAASCFAQWDDEDALLALLGDPTFGVRKSAMYHLGTVSLRRHLAEVAWEHLQRSDVLGVHASETLTTYVKQAEPSTAAKRLLEIAGDREQREGLRYSAVCGLWKLDARNELRALYPILREPPAVTWGLHILLLDAVVEQGIPRPDVRHLRDVDHLHVQEALAALQGSGRWAASGPVTRTSDSSA